MYNVPWKTLQYCIIRVQSKLDSITKNHLLTPTEEESLIQWILLIDRCSMLSRIAVVQEMMCLLVTQHEKQTNISQLWVHNFINHHNMLKSKYNHKHNYQQVQCKDPELIWAWFQHIQNTIAEYSIHNDDIYNFDKTDFQIGIIFTAKVVTGSNQAGKPRTTQSGNHEWITVIETVCAYSYTISATYHFWSSNALSSLVWKQPSTVQLVNHCKWKQLDKQLNKPYMIKNCIQ